MAKTLNYSIHGIQACAELLHLLNAVTQQGLSASILDIGKVCLCDTNRSLSHKDPCPERGINHSKVVIREIRTRAYGKR